MKSRIKLATILAIVILLSIVFTNSISLSWVGTVDSTSKKNIIILIQLRTTLVSTLQGLIVMLM